jgi:hypothetical protein
MFKLKSRRVRQFGILLISLVSLWLSSQPVAAQAGLTARPEQTWLYAMPVGGQTWYLNSISPDSPVDYKDRLVMTKSSAGLTGAEVGIAANGDLIWAVDQAAGRDVVFPGAGNIWSISLHTRSDWSSFCQVQVGQWDSVTDIFDPFPTSQTRLTHSGSQTWMYEVQLSDSPSVPANHYLGIRICNSDPSGAHPVVADAGSYLISPDNDPGYPLYSAPLITLQPSDQTRTEGDSVTFEAAAGGIPAPAVRWQISLNHGAGWTDAAGAGSPSLTLTGLQREMNSYQYRAIFTNSEGSVFSRAAVLSVMALPPVLIADGTENALGKDIDITFADDPQWRAAISSVCVDGVILTSGQYSLRPSDLTLAGAAFKPSLNHLIVVNALGFNAAAVSQAFLPFPTVTLIVPDNVTGKSDFSADLAIDSVTDLNVADYTLTFDPAVLRLDSISPGTLGSTAVPVMSNTTSPGTVRVVNDLHLPQSGISGSGTLAVAHFHVTGIAGQASPITLSNGTLASNLAVEIPAVWLSGWTTVTMVPVKVSLENLNQIYDGTPKPVTVRTDPEGVAIEVTYDNSTAIPLNAGLYSVIARVSDPFNYSGSASGTLVIARAIPLITWNNPDNITCGIPLTATQLNATTGVTGSFVYTPPAGTILKAGPAQTLATSFTPADVANYDNVSASVLINVVKIDQTITFAALSNQGYASPDFTLSATASSGLTVTFTAADNCALVDNTTVHITGIGICTITASQAGDDNFNPAPSVIRTFEVTKMPGDTNGDGSIDSVDIIATIRIVLSLDQPTETADANGDGKINALDIAWIELEILNSTH